MGRMSSIGVLVVGSQISVVSNSDGKYVEITSTVDGEQVFLRQDFRSTELLDAFFTSIEGYFTDTMILVINEGTSSTCIEYMVAQLFTQHGVQSLSIIFTGQVIGLSSRQENGLIIDIGYGRTCVTSRMLP